MQFLNMGPGEIMLILILALIVFGPGKLPEIGRSVGRSIGEFRRATTDLTREFSESIEEVKQPFDEIKGAMTGASTAATAPASAPVLGSGLACPSCSADNPASNKFCRECGARLVAEEAMVACMSCTAANPVSNKFCRECGLPMPVSAPSEVSAAEASAEPAPVAALDQQLPDDPEPKPEADPTMPDPAPAEDPTLPDPKGPAEDIPYIGPGAPEAPPTQVAERVS